MPAVSVAEPSPDAVRQQEFREQAQPLLERYCFDCHGAEEQEGGLALDTFKSPRQILEAKATWLKVIQKLRVEGMPPEDADQPADEERRFLVEWIDGTLNDIDCVREAKPGRVTIRRLSRFEYRNTIRDLVGVEYQPAAEFPADNVGYGFDNIGDVLSLSPILMEKYLSAAEVIAEQARVVVEPDSRLIARMRGAEMEGGGEYEGGARILANQGEMSTILEVPADGRYEVSVVAFGHQAGDELVKMAYRFDDQEVNRFQVEAKGRQPQLFKVNLETTGGQHKLAFAFLNDFYRPGADRNLIVMSVEVHGPLVSSHGSPASQSDAARHILARMSGRAYRRPTTESELDRLLQLVPIARGQGETFEQSIQLALRALLVSPHFLFRVEADPAEGQSTRELNDYELATRLSYFLWSSMPDAELFSLAGQGILRNDGVLEDQIRRMLQDPKSGAFVENFAGQWLNLRNLSRAEPDSDRFPDFDERLRAAMLQETQLFFAAVIHEDRSVLDFLDANYTYLNERLARHYGIPGVQGDEFQRVELSGDERGGVLTHASILTISSNPTRTSPVKRGKWILDNILGTPPPPPPPGVEELAENEAARSSGPLRERLEQHRSKSLCASCHRLMDPLGFGFENFDAIGAWRDRDGEFPIDPSGVLPSGESFQDSRELRSILIKAKKDDFCRCLTEKMLTYGLGRGLEYYDKCAVDTIMKSMAENDFRFSSLVLGIITSEPFQYRGARR